MVELLLTVPLFASLKKAEFEFLAEIARNAEYPPGVILFRQGEVGDRLYVIVKGQLDILRDFGTEEEQLLRICGTGEHVGEMCFLNPEGVRSATVRTRTHVRLIEVGKEDFEALMSRRPAMALTIARGITRRMLESETCFIRALAEKDRQLSAVTGAGTHPKDSACDEHPLVDPPEGTEMPAVEGHAVTRIEIRVLGNFQVVLGETRIDERSWKAKQPKQLLKAIIARGGTGIPKDALIEDLWPEVSPSAGEANFKVVLHRLRKTLEPEMGKGGSSSYILLKENLVFLRKDLCRTDLDEFLGMRARGLKAEKAGDVARALQLYRSALELYAGDFLSEDVYTPWAELKREELRRMYLDLLSRSAELYEAQGSSKKAMECYKQVLAADPVSEEACQKLMLIYSNRGMRSEALKLFEEFKKILEKELGVEPAPLTISIHGSIASKV